MARPNNILPALSQQQAKRFNAKIQKGETEECWPWVGSLRRKKGYGMWRYTVTANKRISISSHRMVLFLATGIQPGNLLTCHKCDNPPCCNPSHLFLGTTRDNARDAKEKGRLASGDRNQMHLHPEQSVFNGPKDPAWIARGEAHGLSKLSESDVREIRRLYTGTHGELSRLGRLFGVSHRNILDVVRRRTWTHIN